MFQFYMFYVSVSDQISRYVHPRSSSCGGLPCDSGAGQLWGQHLGHLHGQPQPPSSPPCRAWPLLQPRVEDGDSQQRHTRHLQAHARKCFRYIHQCIVLLSVVEIYILKFSCLVHCSVHFHVSGQLKQFCTTSSAEIANGCADVTCLGEALQVCNHAIFAIFNIVYDFYQFSECGCLRAVNRMPVSRLPRCVRQSVDHMEAGVWRILQQSADGWKETEGQEFSYLHI